MSVLYRGQVIEGGVLVYQRGFFSLNAATEWFAKRCAAAMYRAEPPDIVMRDEAHREVARFHRGR